MYPMYFPPLTHKTGILSVYGKLNSDSLLTSPAVKIEFESIAGKNVKVNTIIENAEFIFSLAQLEMLR
jgi:hypothetical protein